MDQYISTPYSQEYQRRQKVFLITRANLESLFRKRVLISYSYNELTDALLCSATGAGRSPWCRPGRDSLKIKVYPP
jgi:hypothetical protein